MLIIPEEDKYYSIKAKNRSEIKIKGSKFICTALPSDKIENTNSYLKELKHEFFDATHNCFAYKLGNSDDNFRSSDDGEPSGSAGKPILFTITKYNLTNILVVVTRYFGGTKLGVGGLVRAYSESAEKTLNNCEIVTLYKTANFTIQSNYNDAPLIKRLIANYAINHQDEYTEFVKIKIAVPASKQMEFSKFIFENTEGRFTPTLE